MPAVINTTPTKQLTSCDALAGAVFTTIVSGCNLNLVNQSSLTGITNIEYEISLGATVIDTINTTSTTYVWDAASLYYGETVSIKQTITSGSGTFEVTESVGIPSSLSVCVFEYTTNLAGGDTFSPSSAPTSGTTLWRVPDDTYIRNLSPSAGGSTVGFDGTNNTVIVRPTGGLSALAQIDISSEKVVGFLDCSPLTDTTTILANDNTNLTSIDVSDCEDLQWLDVHNCNLTVVNVAGLTNMLRLYAEQNSNLATLTLEPTANYFLIWAFSCALTSVSLNNITFAANASLRFASNSITSFTYAGADATAAVQFFDISGNAGITGAFDATWINLRNNSNGCQFLIANTGITSVDHTGRSGVIASYNCQVCPITGTLDISMFSFWPFGGTLNTTNISGLTNILMPTSGTLKTWSSGTCALGIIGLNSITITADAAINLSENSFSAAETNGNLVNIENAAVSSGATGTINIAGSNAAPDGSSGGFDGLTAKANLIAAGYTVTTN